MSDIPQAALLINIAVKLLEEAMSLMPRDNSPASVRKATRRGKEKTIGSPNLMRNIRQYAMRHPEAAMDYIGMRYSISADRVREILGK
jgi:hypothetical protein